MIFAAALTVFLFVFLVADWVKDPLPNAQKNCAGFAMLLGYGSIGWGLAFYSQNMMNELGTLVVSLIAIWIFTPFYFDEENKSPLKERKWVMYLIGCSFIITATYAAFNSEYKIASVVVVAAYLSFLSVNFIVNSRNKKMAFLNKCH
jgi:peptidoglycan/LPS O-acetylase OafA/YrhL